MVREITGVKTYGCTVDGCEFTCESKLLTEVHDKAHRWIAEFTNGGKYVYRANTHTLFRPIDIEPTASSSDHIRAKCVTTNTLHPIEWIEVRILQSDGYVIVEGETAQRIFASCTENNMSELAEAFGVHQEE